MNPEKRDKMFDDLENQVPPNWEVEPITNDLASWTELAMVYPEPLVNVSRIERFMADLQEVGYLPVMVGIENVGVKVLMKKDSIDRVVGLKDD